ncbi:UNVERIFIED_CONTAM: hypothetical protein Sangu_2241500 [Sesamum angustifolium]|uniref:Retrotransposon Copia-like N-terminal domain-containing protein n=1 Tax=Sesamum angustifolium TaxID=2727405 RepID=A0AAW2L749_9LAMI
MSLISLPLDRNNYLTWGRAICLVIRAKLKLGKCERLAANADNFEQWQRVEYIEVSWLFNSISEDIAEAFVYTTSARVLWLELKASFGESNGPLFTRFRERYLPLLKVICL